MTEALRDVVEHIKNGYDEILRLLEFYQDCGNKISAKIKIRDYQRGEKWEDVPHSRIMHLEITQRGILLRRGQEAKNYESIEALLQTETPGIWLGYFESKIAERLEHKHLIEVMAEDQ
ncbi:hypothetical protein HWI79_10 [Cryptosporidium felis]|nr:hypothetical protein HWI79_10 [Cryptosporidium felis]